MLKLDELKPYKNNPRRNDEAVQYVANSIEEFGFQVPIVIDKDNVIICGHTRYKASKQLGFTEVPCVKATELSEEQVKAFRVADNKVAEQSGWNIKALQVEMDELKFDFNMEKFGFKLAPPNKPNERIKTVESYNMEYYTEDGAENKWDMPELYGEDYIPEDLMGFNYAKTSKEYGNGIHFYVDDYQFERVWKNPEKYIEMLSAFDCILTPDFSLYANMALPVQMWNIYRSRLIGRIAQQKGLTVIPTVSWSDKRSYEFCFEGLPTESTLSISTIGVKREEEAYQMWKNGVDEMIRRLRPTRLLVYGGAIEYDYGDIEVVYFNNKVTERWKETKKNES